MERKKKNRVMPSGRPSMSKGQDNNKVMPSGRPSMSKGQDNNKVTPSGRPSMSKGQDNNKVKTAVALAYEPGDVAPKILATGKGELAERIIEKGKEENVPLYKDNKLANTLSKLEIGDAIPPELYDVVAEILVFVDDMDRLRSKIK